MKKITFFFSALLLFCSFALQAQVTIGKNQAPQSYSVLELVAQYKSGEYGGFRLPQLTTAQRDALGVTAADTECRGLMIYNMTTNCVETWNGTKWISTCHDSGGAVSPTGSVDIYIGSSGQTLKFMTYNLGANPNLTLKQQMAYSGANPADMTVYGGFYQWGRKDAAHTFRGAPLSPITSDSRFTTDLVTNTGIPNATVSSDPGKFVYGWNWTTPHENNSDLWGNGLAIAAGGNNPQKGVNDPCPSGWRVPTQHEWALLSGGSGGASFFPYGGIALTNSGLYWVSVVNGKVSSSLASTAMCGYALYEQSAWNSAAAGYKDGTLALTESSAPEPLLFLSLAGNRDDNDGYMENVGIAAAYWSSSVGVSSVHGGSAYYLRLLDYVVGVYTGNDRASSHPVRCIAE